MRSPNLLYISSVFDRFSKLLVFYVLYEDSQKKMKQKIEKLLLLIQCLLNNQNYNSAYAAYLAFCNPWLNQSINVKDLKLSKKESSIFQQAEKLFDIEGKNKNLKLMQNKAGNSSVPFLGVYQHQLVCIDELYKTITPDGKINIRKFEKIQELINRMIYSKGYPYEFTPVESILGSLRTMPDAGLLDNLNQKLA